MIPKVNRYPSNNPQLDAWDNSSLLGRVCMWKDCKIFKSKSQDSFHAQVFIKKTKRDVETHHQVMDKITRMKNNQKEEDKRTNSNVDGSNLRNWRIKKWFLFDKFICIKFDPFNLCALFKIGNWSILKSMNIINLKLH